ncbi:putative U6 snRNA-associated Sm-like protein LSm4, partial [Tolypocladium ophioglossoides CBS 100239]
PHLDLTEKAHSKTPALPNNQLNRARLHHRDSLRNTSNHGSSKPPPMRTYLGPARVLPNRVLEANFDVLQPQLPLSLLNAAQGHPMLVELKNGETLNGHLVQCDTWMNLTLKEVVQTSPEGDKFMRLKEAYVKGNNVRRYLVPSRRGLIKYLRVPEEIIDQVSEAQKSQQGGFRGGRGGQSRGEHGGRGGDRGRGRGGGRGGRGRGRGQ